MVKAHSIKYFNEIKSVLDSIDLEVLEKVVNLISKAYYGDCHIFTMGNGGSASNASHFACDINKGVSTPDSRKFKVISLTDNIPLITAYANDLSYEDIFVEQMKNYLKAGDLVIGISGSGKSKNILNAIDYANINKATTIGISGYDGGLLAKKVHLSLNVKVNDMQKCEDVHLILIHIIMQILNRQLQGKNFE